MNQHAVSGVNQARKEELPVRGLWVRDVSSNPDTTFFLHYHHHLPRHAHVVSMKHSKTLRVVLATAAALAIGYTLWIQVALLQAERQLNVLKQASSVIGDYASLVNVFIGTRYGGHVFPGATLPHGMVKVGMDTDSNENVSEPFMLPSWSPCCRDGAT